jgi:predicted small integral membrane protein
MNRIIIAALAILCGWQIYAIVRGAYFLAPITLLLLAALVWSVLRPTNPKRNS